MSKKIMIPLFLLAIVLLPALAQAATTVKVLCSDAPNINCDADYTKPDNCRSALDDPEMKRAINDSVCCTGSNDAKKFTLPAAPTPPAADTVCSDFSVKVSGKGANRKISVKVDTANCNGATCKTALFTDEPCGATSVNDLE